MDLFAKVIKLLQKNGRFFTRPKISIFWGPYKNAKEQLRKKKLNLLVSIIEHMAIVDMQIGVNILT